MAGSELLGQRSLGLLLEGLLEAQLKLAGSAKEPALTGDYVHQEGLATDRPLEAVTATADTAEAATATAETDESVS